MHYIYRIICAAFMVVLTACAPSAPTAAPTLAPSPTSTVEPATPTPLPTVQTIADVMLKPGYLRIVHAAPDLPAVDITLDDSVIANRLAFTAYTESTPVSAGEHLFRLLAADHQAGAPPLLENRFQMESGQSLILLLTGTPAAPQIIALPETLDPLKGGESRISIIHAAPDTPEVALHWNDQALTQPVSFGKASSAFALPSGEASFAFQSGDQTLLDYRLTMRERVNYTLVLTGTPDNLTVIRYDTRVDSQASARFVNVAIPAMPLDLYLDSTRIGDDLAFGKASERLSFIAGQHSAAIYAADADPASAVPLLSTPVILDEDADVALIVIGTKDDLRLIPWAETLAPTPSNQARIAFMNALPDAPDTYVAQSAAPLEGLPALHYTAPPAEIMFEAGTYDLLWLPADMSGNGTARLETAHQLDFQPGFNYLYFLSGAEDAPVILAERVGIDTALSTAVGATPTPFVAARIRVVNVLGGETALDLYADDTLLISNTRVGESSSLVNIPPGHHTLTAKDAGGSTILVSADVDLTGSGSFSVFIYGLDASLAQLLVIEDTNLIFDTQWARIRLVNLSLIQGTLLGLASTQAFPSVQRGDDNPLFDTGERLTLPFGAQRYIDNINSGTASAAVSIPAGSYDVFVLDMQQYGIARRVNNVRLETEHLYDVIAFQAPDSPRVDAYFVPYPER